MTNQEYQQWLKQRHADVMHYYQSGYSMATVAEKVGVSEHVVRTILYGRRIIPREDMTKRYNILVARRNRGSISLIAKNNHIINNTVRVILKNIKERGIDYYGSRSTKSCSS
jgi:predicted DNA-binding protein YlxM (UPF0122 family)